MYSVMSSALCLPYSLFITRFLLPAEGWEVYKRGCLLVSPSICLSQKNYESSQRLKCQIFLERDFRALDFGLLNFWEFIYQL